MKRSELIKIRRRSHRVYGLFVTVTRSCVYFSSALRRIVDDKRHVEFYTDRHGNLYVEFFDKPTEESYQIAENGQTGARLEEKFRGTYRAVWDDELQLYRLKKLEK